MIALGFLLVVAGSLLLWAGVGDHDLAAELSAVFGGGPEPS